MTEQLVIRKLLQEKFAVAQVRNPAFSLRSFAKKLEISPAALSEILNGKRKISFKLAHKLSKKLMLSPQESQMLIQSFQIRNTPSEMKSQKKEVRLSQDQFQLIGEWQHFAILSLAETKDFKSSDQWIADRLGLSLQKTKLALSRLIKLGLLKKVNEQYIVTGESYSSPDEVVDLALRRMYSEVLDLSKDSLLDHELQQRDFSGVTMAIDPSRLPLAKKLIRKMLAQVCEILEVENKSEVYRLNVQLIPLTKLKK